MQMRLVHSVSGGLQHFNMAASGQEKKRGGMHAEPIFFAGHKRETRERKGRGKGKGKVRGWRLTDGFLEWIVRVHLARKKLQPTPSILRTYART